VCVTVNDVYIQMAGFDVSIWLCKVCLPNLVMYLPVSSSKVKRRHGEGSISLLQAKVSEIAEKSERQMALVMINIGSQNVQKK
jgi:hypothetical protein